MTKKAVQRSDKGFQQLHFIQKQIVYSFTFRLFSDICPKFLCEVVLWNISQTA